ncbi:MAG: hypothetical protein COV45_05325 [Deltaproteobacteria bacterium CG11_big_fil_rev_8_21_14_0_20_47_16]|nr:MAG: hypothetical protein COV45_05325 [Deltaproteobacteria bacterium CG11_big_fil_rev_8_21_14_0_20_47_16]
MKKLLLSLPYGMSARNFLGSSVFSMLRRHFQVVLATPLHKDPAFCAEFNRQGVEVVDIPKPPIVPMRLYRHMLDIMEGVHFSRKTQIKTLQILENCLKRERPGIYYRRKIIGSILLAVPGLFKFLRGIQNKFIGMPYYEKLLDEVRPDVIFQTHPLCIDEFPMALHAKKAGIPVVAMLHSWDNITTKSGIRVVTSDRPGRMLPIMFDHFLVWNEVQKAELMRYYGYSEAQITVTGMPQFDFYKTYQYSSREIFCKKWGLDPKKKLIVFTAGSPKMLPKQNEVIDILIDSVMTDKFGHSAQLLIRTHPMTKMEYLKDKLKESFVQIQYPKAAYVTDRITSGWNNSHDDQSEFAETIHHADVVINVASTVCLDCAALDKPSICVAFDGHSNMPYHQSIVKNYDFDHFLPIINSGGVRIARSAAELREMVNNYIVDPSLDSEGRAKLREVECYRVDGNSAERVADALAAFAYGAVSQRAVGT